MLNDYFVDLHIHIGRTRKGAAVKISAAPSLTLENIIREAAATKGIDIVGVIDCHVKEVLAEIQEAIECGVAEQLEGGGIRYSGVTLFLGTEIELNDEEGQGPIHVLAYFPTVEKMQMFSNWMEERMKNHTLSSQRIYAQAKTVQKIVREYDGLFVPAHVFTPFKSLYGKGVQTSLSEILDPNMIDAIELGLSSDTTMADQITELHRYPYLTNSDAHSLEKIAREYQLIKMKEPSFHEFRLALKGKEGRKIVSNFGLNPLLGKYYRTICAKCEKPIATEQCEFCQSTRKIKGVSNRLTELASEHNVQLNRPPYVHQVPLEFIPKVGKKTIEKLRAHFGTDMNIIHNIKKEQLEEVVSKEIATMIISARVGELKIKAGGGGTYGKVSVKK